VTAGALALSLVGCATSPENTATVAAGRGPLFLESPAPARVVPVAARTARPKPNILLLLTDDQNATDMRAMPRTSRLMGELGTTFTRAVSQYPLCSPARASLLTGQEAHNHGVMGNNAPWGGFSKLRDRETVPVWLRRAGYHTTLLGKYLQGYENTPRYIAPGWDEWYVPGAGAYDYYTSRVNENGRLRWHSGTYQTTYVANRATALIKRQAAARKPFFTWVNFLAPHFGSPVESDDPRATTAGSPVDTPAVESRYRDTARGLRNPRSAAFNEPDMSDKPREVRRAKLRDRYLDESLQQRRESLRSVDDAVVRIIRTLRRTGELRNTVIVFSSDNGFMTGQHRWFQKILGYEESTRIPLYVAGPGFEPGAVRRQLVTLTDVAATFLAVSRADPTLDPDGLSLRRFSQDPGYRADRSVLLEAGGSPHQGLDRIFTGVRTPNGLVYLRWHNGHEEVYDLRRDPHEVHGEIDDLERRHLGRLRAALDALQGCRGVQCTLVRQP
jgi:arylsulfatase A-like enzyme